MEGRSSQSRQESRGAGDTSDSAQSSPRGTSARALRRETEAEPERRETGNASDSAASRASSPSPRPTKKSRAEPREWNHFRTCNGWADVVQALREVSATCIQGGCDLLAGVNHQSTSTIVYKYRCPFYNSHGCKWSCRVVIHRHGTAAQAVLCRTPVERARHHANHTCEVQYDISEMHVPHNGQQAKGPHAMWVVTARADHSMYNWKRMQIEQWFRDNNIAVEAGQMKTAVTRCMRHNTKTGKALVQKSFGITETSCQRAALVVMCDKMLFKNVVKSPGFNVHEPYFIPGSLVRDLSDDTDSRPALVLMITTLNLILNVARSNAMPGSAGAVAGVDHTHKVVLQQSSPCLCNVSLCVLTCACIVQMAAEGTAPHLSVNVIGMDLVAHMVAFGPVCDETEQTTAYALKIVMTHAREAAAFAKAMKIAI